MENGFYLTINGNKVLYNAVDYLDDIEILRKDGSDDDIEIRNGKINGCGAVHYENRNEILIGNFVNGELEGKGKVYNRENELLYEGEFVNGKREGKGKEYYKNGNVACETEFKNDKPNGKFKTYNFDGKIKFKGNFINGIVQGECEAYDIEGKLIFEGYYKNNAKKKGKLALEEGYYYEGEFNNNDEPTFGKLYLLETNKRKYCYRKYGNHVHGPLANSEKLTRTDLADIEKYEPVQVTKQTEFCMINDSVYIPRSKKSFISSKYISENMKEYYSDNKRILLEEKPLAKNDEVDLTINGKCETYTVTRIVKTNGGKKIIGLKKKDEAEIFYDENKNLFYKNCKLNNQTLVFPSEKIYIYDCMGRCCYSGYVDASGLFNGEGQLYNESRLVYDGEFLNGNYHGKGKKYGGSGLIYEGEFKNGKRHGNGVEYKDGEAIRGVFENGYLVAQLQQQEDSKNNDEAKNNLNDKNNKDKHI